VLSNTDNIVLRLLPSFFPAVAAIVTAAVLAGTQGVRDLLGQVGKLRVSPVWYLIALAGPVTLSLLAFVLAIPFGQAFPVFQFPGIRLLPVILIATFFALMEELGWRGFALSRLQSRFSALFASLIVGLLWWAWHLPEALAAPGAGLLLQQIVGLQFRDLILDVTASIVMTWIYNRTGGSVFLAALFHLSIGLIAEFLVNPSVSSTLPVAVLFDVLFCIAAAIVVLVTGPDFRARKESEVPGMPAPYAINSSNTSTVQDIKHPEF
jgi:membrane protease YdiL (CAAX protease family)